MPGSGTFGVEAVLTCAVPPDGKWLIVINGAYGERMAKICEVNRIACTTRRYAEDAVPDPADINQILSQDPAITAVAVVHCETTTGIMNPIEIFEEDCRSLLLAIEETLFEMGVPLK